MLEKCADYLVFQNEGPVTESAAKELFGALPENAAPENKIVLGIYNGNSKHLIGVIDLIEHYPEHNALTIGLLVLEPSQRRKEIGSVAYRQLEDWALHRHIGKIRLGVLFGNDVALTFWGKLGFEETGEVKPYGSNRFLVLEKNIAGCDFR